MHVFELRPNCSLTSRAAALLYLSILAVSLPVATACALAGFWPVLPFAGAELLGFAVALHVSMRHGRMRELIRIDQREVTVHRSSGARSSELHFRRPWTRVRLAAAEVPHWPSKLLLGSSGRSVEVGAFLTESERLRLGKRLTELLPGKGAQDFSR